MKISEHDAMLILHPELRDPEQERRRLETLAAARELFPNGVLTPENLKNGIPLPERRRKINP